MVGSTVFFRQGATVPLGKATPPSWALASQASSPITYPTVYSKGLPAENHWSGGKAWLKTVVIC